MSLLKHLSAAAAVAASIAFAASSAHAESRTALVIGNAGYTFGKLENPVNDARDMADALRGSGFEVILKTDADQATMKDAIRSFSNAMRTKGGVGLLYFSGHGVQANGENYLLPLGEKPDSEAALKAGGVTAAEAVDAMAAAGNALNIVILDACRDNPWQAGGSKGLSRIDSSSNLFVSFATSPGEVALDGSGRNSPYTKYLKSAVSTPNLTLEDTFKKTLKGVYQDTKGQQQPWISSSFFGEFVFKPDGNRPAMTEAPAGPAIVAPLQQAAVTSQPRAAPAYRQQTLDLGGLYLVDGSNPNGSRYRGMAALTQTGNQYRFTWWIQRQVFSGVGQFAGRMLVVNWGAKSPVIYNVAANDNLVGEWADGSATDKLTLYARAASSSVRSPGGRYNVDGRNPNGSRYRGTVNITPIADHYRFDWKVGSQSYYGDGTMDGNVLVVNWGSATPVIYAIAEDGSLKGLWDAGRAGEILTPER
jgi:caspase domain-containing protein